MVETVSINAPASKSATQRALLLAALANGTSVLHGPLDCDDTRALAAALNELGVPVERTSARWTVHGGPLRTPRRPIDCSNAGSCIRFLAAASLLVPGPMTLDAKEQLRTRPMDDVADALQDLGMQVEFHAVNGYAPFTLSRKTASPGEVRLDASRTSQFLSGLLMVAPRLGGLEIHVGETVISRPYVDLTLAWMSAFGGPAVDERKGRFSVPAGGYRTQERTLEGDWSAGAMLLTAGWITGLEVKFLNLDRNSAQGDRAIAQFLKELEQPREHNFVLDGCPDLVTPLAVACAFASHPSEIRNVAHARIKESDRIAASVGMLKAVGIAAEARENGLSITPGGTVHPATIEDYSDHRVAMAAGLLSLRIPGVSTANPGCVAKSFPEFWDVLEELRCSLP